MTDYALDELDPRARGYVESLLAVSEEARQDVAGTIEVTRLLEAGYERERCAAEVQELGLYPGQRLELTRPKFVMRRVVRDVAGVLALAACVAFVLTRVEGELYRRAWHSKSHVSRWTARAIEKAKARAGSVNGTSLAAALGSLSQFADEKPQPEPEPPASEFDLPEPTIICTPPPLVFDGSILTGAR